MPRIDVACQVDTCGAISEVDRRIADYPATPPCPACGGATLQTHLPRAASTAPPVIVFLAPDGSYRYPGEGDGYSARRYESLGYQRLELRGAMDVRRFEQQVNRKEDSRAMRKNESQHAAREYREHQMRSDLRQKMQSMTRRGRDLARAVMARNDQKTSNVTKPSNFHSEVYSYDRSNREPGRDRHGRRLRD